MTVELAGYQYVLENMVTTDTQKLRFLQQKEDPPGCFSTKSDGTNAIQVGQVLLDHIIQRNVDVPNTALAEAIDLLALAVIKIEEAG